MTRNELKFWLIFLLLNTLLFLPRYILELETSTFFPPIFPEKGDTFLIGPILVRRFNYDIFRISVDLILLTVIYFFLRKKIKSSSISWFAGAYYLIILLFVVYYNAFEKIYQVKPLLISDLYLLKLAFYNVGNSKLFLFITLPLGFLALFLLTRFAFLYYFRIIEKLRPGKLSWSLSGGILLVYFLNIVTHGMTFTPSHVYQLSGALIVDNFILSAEASESRIHLNLKASEKKYDYKKFGLTEKPDVYLIMLESYGNIVNQNRTINNHYAGMVRRYDSLLSQAGWNVTSTLSISPVSGGKSWLAFTSVIYGTRIADQGSYLNLLRNPEVQEYTHLIKYLHRQNYETYWINPLPNRKNISIPWKLYTDFYTVDHWILDSDLKYTGERFGFGPSPPDQYSMYYTYEIINADAEHPHFLFFITQNSHTPFNSPETVTINWKSLNGPLITTVSKPEFLKKPDLGNYIRSIEYELDMLTGFILNDSSENSVYILLGDHQPPVLTGPGSGFETPLHIISKDEKFIEGFREYGFGNGFNTKYCSKPVRHEALYSILMRELNRNYGSNPAHLPAYLPYGITGKKE